MHLREVQTCMRCRESKRRCDKAKPACSRCVRAGVQCSFDGQSTAERVFSTYAKENLPPDVTDTCESITSEIPSTRSSERQSSSVLLTPPPNKVVKRRNRACLSCSRCHRIKVRCDKKQPCGRCASSGYHTTCIYTHKTSTVAREQNPDSHIVLASEDPEVVVTTWFLRRRGSSHWRALLSRAQALEHVGSEVFNVALREHTENRCMNDLFLPGNFPLGTPDAAKYASIENVHDLIQGSRDSAYIYLKAYANIYHKIYPVLDIEDFEIEGKEYLESPTQVDVNWLSQYLIVLGLGAFATKDQHLAKAFFFASEACLAKSPYMFRPCILNISTLCLMIVAKQVANATCWALDSCWNIMGMLVRLAVMMGLHLDGGTLCLTKNVIKERALHRRVWTIIVYLDIQLALITGQSSALPPDALLVGEDTLPPSCMISFEDCWKSVLPESFPIIYHFLTRINSSDGTISYDEVLQYDLEIRQRMQYLVGLEGDEILRITLDIFFRRVLSCLHRSHALHFEGPALYPTSYWSSLECSLALLVHHRALSEQPSDDSLHGQLVCRPFMLDFFAAALTTGVHLTRRDAPLSATFTSEGMIPPRQTIVDTLKSCLEIVEREKDESLCFRSGCRLLSSVCSVVWASSLQDEPHSDLSTH